MPEPASPEPDPERRWEDDGGAVPKELEMLCLLLSLREQMFRISQATPERALRLASESTKIVDRCLTRIGASGTSPSGGATCLSRSSFGG